jgi:hypothetical protein
MTLTASYAFSRAESIRYWRCRGKKKLAHSTKNRCFKICVYNGGESEHRGKEKDMPAFGSPFAGNAAGRKLTREEVIRSVRFMIAAEYEAVQLYLQLAESTDNELVQKVMRDVADEELVHAGEFLRLLYEIAPDEKRLYAEGMKEVEEEFIERKTMPGR